MDDTTPSGPGGREPDLPTIRADIRADPAAKGHWLALAEWLEDHREADRAAIVRAYWPLYRATAAAGRDPVETILRLPDRDVRRLSQFARVTEQRRLRPPKD